MPDLAFLAAIGIMLIIVGFFLIISGMMRSTKESGGKGMIQEKIKGGGVILIGPVPIVFGTDKKYAFLLVILAIVLMVMALLYLKWQILRH